MKYRVFRKDENGNLKLYIDYGFNTEQQAVDSIIEAVKEEPQLSPFFVLQTHHVGVDEI